MFISCASAPAVSHIPISKIPSSEEIPNIYKGLPRSGTPPTFRSRKGLPEKRKIRDVKKVVAVSSAKGGVGKSTVAG